MAIHFWLRLLFAIAATFAIWAWALQFDIRLPTVTATVFTVLLLFRAHFASLAALVGGLGSLAVFQTCACGHISSSPALGVTIPSAALAWYGLWRVWRSERTQAVASFSVALVTTFVLLRNVQDLAWIGHHPIWPDSPIADSRLPAIVHNGLGISVLAALFSPLFTSIFHWEMWAAMKRHTNRRGPIG